MSRGRVVALLRGINVGKSTRIGMAPLRSLVEAQGHQDVATYLQSGNVVLTPGQRVPASTLAEQLSTAVHREFGVTSRVVVLTATQWQQVVDGNPYPDAADPRHVHAAVQQDPVGAAQRQALEDLLEGLQSDGCPDQLTVRGRVTYLHTPDGLGRSRLAERLARQAKATGQDSATARNWRTVLAIQDLLQS